MARFVISASHPDFYPHHNLPEFALIGPSNAGKSTLINSLAKEKIAHISKKPGKTRTLNFYDFEKFYLVDMPGYGYAQGSKGEVKKLSQILDKYFSDREIILGVFQVCSMHGLSEKDLEVLEYLRERFHNYTLLINKVDKLSSSEQKKLLDSVLKSTNLDPESVILISGKNSINVALVKKKIDSWR